MCWTDRYPSRWSPGWRAPAGARSSRPSSAQRRWPRQRQPRPPRRVEVTHPADVLRSLTLVDTPGAGDLDAPGRDVVLDAAQCGAGLLFVTAAGTRLAVAELDLLTEAAKRGVPVVFVTTGPDPGGPDTTGPETAGPDTAGPDQAGPDEPLVAQAPAFTGSARVRLGADARARTPTASAAPAVTVAALATDERWREILDRETRSRRVSLVQRLVIDLAT